MAITRTLNLEVRDLDTDHPVAFLTAIIEGDVRNGGVEIDCIEAFVDSANPTSFIPVVDGQRFSSIVDSWMATRSGRAFAAEVRQSAAREIADSRLDVEYGPTAHA